MQKIIDFFKSFFKKSFHLFDDDKVLENEFLDQVKIKK
jgi:hypothetical protein